jgi:hypothetical protein
MRLFWVLFFSIATIWLLFKTSTNETDTNETDVDYVGERILVVEPNQQKHLGHELSNKEDNQVAHDTDETFVLDDSYFDSEENLQEAKESESPQNGTWLNDSKRRKIFFQSFRKLLKDRGILTYEERKSVVKLLGSVFESLKAERAELNSLLEEVLVFHEDPVKFSNELLQAAAKYREKRQQFYKSVITSFDQRLEELGLDNEVKRSVVLALQEVLEKQIVVP